MRTSRPVVGRGVVWSCGGFPGVSPTGPPGTSSGTSGAGWGCSHDWLQRHVSRGASSDRPRSLFSTGNVLASGNGAYRSGRTRMLSDRLERAIRLCLKAHAGQVRKADPGVPYATHPIHVAFLVRDAGGDEETVIAALLHDLLEDTDVTIEDLEDAFGPRVTGIVRELSEDKSLPWEERKARMVSRLHSASREAKLIAAADKTHNLQTLAAALERTGPSVWRAFRGGTGPTIRFYSDAFEAVRDAIPQELEEAYRRALAWVRQLQPRSG
ncbi:MAG: HD domain-containing protein [Candidatus Eisenbacteria bacterium]|nr:HD domain-containing protein [Candidatus Latescibacterota bacterium]MBD3302240.1 HD domain-containing protein [Candidatus Eisenbacteria bacterium]